MAHPNISENNRIIGKVALFFDPLHQQVVGLTTVECFRETVPQLQTKIDTIDENAASQAIEKSGLQAILDEMQQ